MGSQGHSQLGPQAWNPMLGIGLENEELGEDLVEESQSPDGQRQSEPRASPHPRERRSQTHGSAYGQEWDQNMKDS